MAQASSSSRTTKEDPVNLESIYISPEAPRKWIRGVNLGGWLLLERYITPYQFSITSCHLKGDFCWYPGQIDAPPKDSRDYQVCDIYACHPHVVENVDGTTDYPMDEFTLAGSFADKETGAKWLNYHFEHFLKRSDLVALKEAGATHVRVPLPHWILEEPRDDEAWIAGDRWKYFMRMVEWCREIGLEVWPDMHTAPGNQNGFDNSGQFLKMPTCDGWVHSPENVIRQVKAVRDIAHAIKSNGLGDVVTGFGLLNEPFIGCDKNIIREYYDDGLEAVRGILGEKTFIYIGDVFEADKFNDGFWQESPKYENTLLDSHYYHVFAERPRALSPRGHIAYVCQKNYRDATSCCYEDPPKNSKPSKGMARLFGEWSVSFDTLVVVKLYDITEGIAKTGLAPEFDRQLPPGRKEFLKHFAQAQMITYEAAELGTSAGWFYWNFKMEGGAFAEWDFLRGIREGWLPNIPPRNISSEEHFDTTCHNLIFRTDDNVSIVKEFPDPDNLPANTWMGEKIDDDVVSSHGDSLLKGKKVDFASNSKGHHHRWFGFATFVFFGVAIWHVFIRGRRDRNGYSSLGPSTQLSV